MINCNLIRKDNSSFTIWVLTLDLFCTGKQQSGICPANCLSCIRLGYLPSSFCGLLIFETIQASPNYGLTIQRSLQPPGFGQTQKRDKMQTLCSEILDYCRNFWIVEDYLLMETKLMNYEKMSKISNIWHNCILWMMIFTIILGTYKNFKISICINFNCWQIMSAEGMKLFPCLNMGLQPLLPQPPNLTYYSGIHI